VGVVGIFDKMSGPCITTLFNMLVWFMMYIFINFTSKLMIFLV